MHFHTLRTPKHMQLYTGILAFNFCELDGNKNHDPRKLIPCLTVIQYNLLP